MTDAVNALPGATSTGKSPGQRRRRYDASGRRAAAEQTRIRILDAARLAFLADGYRTTTIAAIARAAEVAPDTVYATIGRKPELFATLIELALSGTSAPVVGADRDYAVRMRAEPDVRERLRIYAGAVTELQGRLAPLFLVLREAAAAEIELRELWQQITRRRAQNMRVLAGELAAAGGMRTDLSVDEVADIIWTMNSSEYYAMLVAERGWTPDRFREWIFDAWCRLLLA
ncbi:TetR family transcriptional regulator [Gordonia sp. ABSL1-1]|uniref:TetR/AcrR family transcriptional regulator n=1 Tax=Gordonia sp. ABSL1-1 TaxID=3053923 RepID=UPI0025722F47|nr:TetR family transcriptional regulator [Gordonia sp. ABSL1-1]MDL9936326.1 TetR family transcriptional regulator [Gordonia sp. ABSL1-1]